MDDLLEQMKQRLEQWWEQAAGRARIEGETASITFELNGACCGRTTGDEYGGDEIYEVAVEEKFYTDHLGGTVKRHG